MARDDVAASAAAVLADPDTHAGATYDLTGPGARPIHDVAATPLGAPRKGVTYHDEKVPEAYESRRQWEAPDWQYDAWVSTYTAIAAGECAGPATTCVG